MLTGKQPRIPCNLCAADDPTLRYQVNGWDIVRCCHCTLAYVSPLPDEAFLRNYYDQDFYQGAHKPAAYEDYLRDKDFHMQQFRDYWPLVCREIAEPGRVLDVGCAMGFFLEMARAEGWEAYGIDLSDFAASWARREMGLDVRTGTLLDVHFPSGYFDVVTMWSTVEHLVDPLATLVEAARVLRPGGLILITTGEVDGVLDNLSRGLCYWYEPPAHLYYFSIHALRAMLCKAGFDPVRVQGIELDPCMVAPFKRPILRPLNKWLPVNLRRWLRLSYRAGRYALEWLELAEPERIGNLMVALGRKPRE